MKDWLDNWRQWLAPPPPPAPPPPAPEAPAMNQRVDWRAALLEETSLNWTGALGVPVPEAAPMAPVEAPIEAPAAPEAAGPDTALTRSFFTRLGFEPGRRPPTFMAYRALMQRVYGPCVGQLVPRIVEDTPLFGAIDTWPGAPPSQRLALVQILFTRLSHHTGVVFGFRPAPLTMGRGIKKGLLALYTEEENRVVLMDVLLQAHAAMVVTTVVHEQLHRLQAEKVAALRTGRLTPAERSLALYWEAEGVADFSKDYMDYRYNGREYQAHQLSQALGLQLCKVFGWPLDHRIL